MKQKIRSRLEREEGKGESEVEKRKDKNCVYGLGYRVQASKGFTVVVNGAIILNTVCLAMDRYPIKSGDL